MYKCLKCIKRNAKILDIYYFNETVKSVNLLSDMFFKKFNFFELSILVGKSLMTNP